MTPAPGKHCARSALRHLEKASLIAELDPEMAVFRGITAEEEAASAVFHAVRRHHYVGAAKLNPRDHLQKNALGPFCAAVAELFAVADRTLALRPQVFIEGEDEGRRLQIQFHTAGIGIGDGLASPRPPLHFAVSEEPGALHDFGEQLQAIASAAGAHNILAHIRKRANARNEVLYASAAGIPSVTLGNFLEQQRTKVKVILILYLLIDPYPEHQLFVSQALLAFLKMLEKLPTDIAF